MYFKIYSAVSSRIIKSNFNYKIVHLRLSIHKFFPPSNGTNDIMKQHFKDLADLADITITKSRCLECVNAVCRATRGNFLLLLLQLCKKMLSGPAAGEIEV